MFTFDRAECWARNMSEMMDRRTCQFCHADEAIGLRDPLNRRPRHRPSVPTRRFSQKCTLSGRPRRLAPVVDGRFAGVRHAAS
jgi:hypothetical protein